jgi:hypothetical protein
MKKRTQFLLTILTISYCGLFGQTLDDSISKATALIKKYVTSETKNIINIKIINSHNGRHTITSTLRTIRDSVSIYSYIVDMTGGKRDTVLNLSKETFLIKLDKASIPINSMKLAGHVQTISVRLGDKEDTIQTVDGRAIMDLLESGE